MDANGFREPQSPWFFTQPPQFLVETRVNKVAIPRKDTQATPDNRFPGWAAPMNDGRLVTDYRPKCAVNIPTGTQYASRQFMIHNTDSIITQSRRRQADKTGAGLSFDSRTDVPAEQFVKCESSCFSRALGESAISGFGDKDQCSYINNVSNGVGVERLDSVPALFGTFAYSSPSWLTPATPAITTRFEGGRNTPRGNF